MPLRIVRTKTFPDHCQLLVADSLRVYRNEMYCRGVLSNGDAQVNFKEEVLRQQDMELIASQPVVE